MKRLVPFLIALLTIVLVYAAEMTPEQKNQCLLASKGCVNQVDTLQQKIRKLDAEIKKGKRVYSPEELKKLNDKLKEAEDMVDVITKTPGS